MTRRINAEGLAIIKKWEGLKLEAYRCPAGVCTIGYGHTRGVKMGDVIDEEQAEEYLDYDLQRFEQGVSDRLRVNVTDNQFSAMVSLAFNIGLGNFQKSSVLRYTNGRFPKMAAQSFLMWNKAGGKVLAGLEARRKDERDLYLKDLNNDN